MIKDIIASKNFELKRVRTIAEMKGRLWEMEHPQSGAKLVWLDRPDENMTFAIGFRTIPTDSTGVFHILEHSVLGGSELYPVKEPFVELLKSSLKTFLNAMTFPDKTVYPVSSRNKQDFRNLIGIYMDAVLHPLAVKNPNVFRQEGWRVEQDEEGKPIFQGVVYNEMKGYYSDVRSVTAQAVTSRLFPDTCYRHEAGGNPAHIPELTYEQFVSEHAKYYHPSNSMIFLDGQVDLEGTLDFLDSVLSQYEKQEMVFPIPFQTPVSYVEHEVPYEIGAEEDTAGKTIIARGRLLCRYNDPETLLGAQILADYLAGDTEAPLKKAVLDAKLGADFSVMVHDGMQQAWIGWQVTNTDNEKLPQIKKLLHSVMTKMADNGLDRQRLAACYNSLAFGLMDRDSSGFPRGLLEGINVMETWSYGGDPAQNLAYQSVLTSLKDKLETNFFEELLRTTLLDTTKGVLVCMVPSRTLGAKRIKNEQQRVNQYWKNLTAEEIQAHDAELEALHRWQQTPNTPEELASIPMLKLSDLTDDPKPIPVEESKAEGVTVLTHNTVSDLAYINLHFEASDLTKEEMPLLNLLGILLGTLPTEVHNAADLQNAIKEKIGKLDISAEVYNLGIDKHRTFFSARTVCLPDARMDCAALMEEILNKTVFADRKLLSDILHQQKTRTKRSLVSSGNRYAAGRVVARQTSVGAAKEYFSGLEYIRWIQEQCKLPEHELGGLLNKLSALAQKLIVKQRLTVSVSENAADTVNCFVGAFADDEASPAEGSMELLPACAEGILIPAAVGFAAKGANIRNFGGSFSGHSYVLSNLMRFEYLWGAIRVQGGAYGTGFLSAESGDVVCTSFRDPNPARSIGCFDQCADFLEAYCAEHEDLTKFILGALSDTDPLLDAEGKIRIAESRWIKHVSFDDVLTRSRQLRQTTIADLTEMVDYLRKTAQTNNLCIVGGKEQLDACGDMLENVVDIFA